MSERKWPVSGVGTRWLTYCPHDGWAEHDTPEDGERAFSATFEYLSYNARHDGEWFDDADSAAWGVWIPIDRLAFVACGDDDDDDDRVVVDGVVQRVEPDAAALEFCASFADVVSRERIAELEAEVDRLRSIADNAPPPADVQMLASANRTLAAEVERLRAEVERLASDVAKVRADRDRLAKWLADIEGGDNPCDDAATLRRWAYEAVTFGKEVSDV